ncbi:MAG: methyltransferase domain-containing protein [Chloroflexota bacterium]|nr:methyltransferase domain-containing protein [Chloroflexota bacterium]
MASLPRWRQIDLKAAETYERLLVPAMFAPWAPALVDLAGIRAGERVLDVACGTGVVTRLAAERAGDAGPVVGLDINAAMLAVAREHQPTVAAQVEWIEASAIAMPLPDASFDVVLCQQGLQQFPDRPAALAEMRRVLVPGGRLVLSVWSRIEESPGMAALAEALERHMGAEAANNRRAPFALGDAVLVGDLLAAAELRDIEVRTRVETAHFPSPEALVDAQIAATPLSTLQALSEETRRAVARDVRAALRAYVVDGMLAVPMAAHLALARA